MVPDSQHKRLYKVWKGNNNFFCGGRCIFGPDVTSLSLSILLIAGPAITFCYQIHAKIQHRKYHEEESVYDNQLLGFPVLVATIIALLADLTFLLLTSSRDPGIIPRNSRACELSDGSEFNTPSFELLTGITPHLRLPKTKEVIVNGFAIKLKYCDTCLLYRPPRASHCSVCNNCVQKFDHHCPWVGQCIGLRNYRFFLLFISTSAFLCIFIFTLSFVSIFHERKNYQHSFMKLILGEIISVILMLYTFLSVWFVGGLTVFHLYLLYTNQTTYENFRYHFDKTNNPFNIGVLRNIKEVFFSRIAPSMINFRAWNLDEAVVNDMYASCVGMDVICKDEKFNTEKDGRMPFPTILHNFGYNFISENKIAVNKLEGNFPDPSALPNIQKQNLQGLGENKQNCRGEDGSIAGNMVGLIEDGTAIDGVANEGNSSSEIIVPANQHANVQEI